MANSNQNIETPWAFVKAVEELFGIKFKYDMAGTEENKKAPIVFTEEQDSLSIDWPRDGWCWINPPFKHVGRFADKCREEYLKGAMIMSIWPLSGDFNMINTWKHSDISIVHGRVWKETRGVMLCEWNMLSNGRVDGLRWDKKNGTLTREWWG